MIEEFLDGPEVSLFAVTDGETVVPLQPAQDFKRALDGDEGPNTGGMGAYSPLPWADPKLVDEVLHTVLQPTVDEMRRRGTPFSGLLYAGLAITSRGVRVIEFNARFGDPETQVVLARLQTPLAGVLMAAATAQPRRPAAAALERGRGRHRRRRLAQLPGHPRTGRPDYRPGRGGRRGRPARVRACTPAPGGTATRWSARADACCPVTATGTDLAEARERAYRAVGRIRLDGSQHRTDIAAKAAESADA